MEVERKEMRMGSMMVGVIIKKKNTHYPQSENWGGKEGGKEGLDLFPIHF